MLDVCVKLSNALKDEQKANKEYAELTDALFTPETQARVKMPQLVRAAKSLKDISEDEAAHANELMHLETMLKCKS